MACLTVENPGDEREHQRSHGASPIGALTGGWGPPSLPLPNDLRDQLSWLVRGPSGGLSLPAPLLPPPGVWGVVSWGWAWRCSSFLALLSLRRTSPLITFSFVVFRSSSCVCFSWGVAWVRAVNMDLSISASSFSSFVLVVTGEVFFESSLCQFVGGFEGVPDVEVSRE